MSASPPLPGPDDRLAVTVKEAARLLSISTRTVHRCLKDGDLKRLKIGRSCRVTLASIRALAERTAK